MLILWIIIINIDNISDLQKDHEVTIQMFETQDLSLTISLSLLHTMQTLEQTRSLTHLLICSFRQRILGQTMHSLGKSNKLDLFAIM